MCKIRIFIASGLEHVITVHLCTLLMSEKSRDSEGVTGTRFPLKRNAKRN